MKKWHVCFILLASSLFFPTLGWSFYGDGPTISATLVTDKGQTGESSDREYTITAVNSEGTIAGDSAEGHKEFQFKDLERITYDPQAHAHTVVTKDGKTATLKHGRLKTHYTSPTFDCMIWDESQKKEVEQMMDSTTFKSLVFTTKEGTKKEEPKKEEVKKEEPKKSEEPVSPKN